MFSFSSRIDWLLGATPGKALGLALVAALDLRLLELMILEQATSANAFMKRTQKAL